MTAAARSRARAASGAWSVTLRVLSGGVLACGGWAAVLGSVGLAGHVLELEGLQRWVPGSETMGLRASLVLVVSGLGLVASQLHVRQAALAAGALTAALAAASLVEALVVPSPAWREAAGAAGAAPPLAPFGACGFLAAGAGLVLVSWRASAPLRLGAGLLGLVTLTVAALVLFGLESELDVALGWGHRTGIGLPAAAGAALVGAGLVTFAWGGAAGEGGAQVQARRLGLTLAAAGALASALVWDGLVDHEHMRTQARVEENAARLVRELERRLQDRLQGFDRLARRWAVADGVPRDAWQSDALAFVVGQPGHRALVWLDAAGQPRWQVASPFATTASGSRSWQGEVRETLAAARAARAARASRRIVYSDGRAGCLLVAPVQRPSGRWDGFLVTELDVGPLLEETRRQQARLGYRFALQLDGEPLVGPTEAEGPYARTWGQRGDLLLGGRRWDVRTWPAPEALSQHSTALPDLALGAGLLLSLALALTGHFALRERDRSREAQAARVALERELEERRGMEQRLAAQAERLEQAALALSQSNRDLEEFAYVAAHDLRSPLRAIHNLSEWIAEDLGPALEGEAGENMQLLQARVERMDRLLDSLLHYSRAGRRADAPEQVEAGEVVRAAWAGIPGTERFELDVGELPALHTPRAPLEQVFHNLLGNAVKHHDREQGRLVVRAEPVDERLVAFSVGDDGPGIPPEFHQRVFGMFKTLRPRDKVEGSGIGLALIKRVVNRYGGSVGIVSPGGRGTTVRFTWPREPLEPPGSSAA